MARPAAVGVVERDLHAVRELAPLEVAAAQADELRLRDRHALRLVRQIDRPLLDDAVDVIPPRVVIEQAVDRKFQLVVQTIEHSAHPARRLTGAVGENTVVLLPEFILVEPLPDGAFFDVEDKFGVALFELNDIRLDDRRDGVAAGAHPGAVDFVSLVFQDDIADHISPLIGEEMKLLAQRVEQNLAVFDDRVALPLVGEGRFLRRLDIVLEHIVQTTDARGFSHFDELFGAAGDQDGLHKALRLAQVEELAVGRALPHFEDAPGGVVADIRQRPRGDRDRRIPLSPDTPAQEVGQTPDTLEGPLILLGKVRHFGSFQKLGRFGLPARLRSRCGTWGALS